MELRHALDQIAEIRQQMARSQTFRGYRSLSALISGFVALATAGLQGVLLRNPAHQVDGYVTLWLCSAGVCMAVVGVEMFVRLGRSQCHVQSQLTFLAIEQFMPSVVAGALLTWVLALFAPATAWALPGLWMILFSLGVFASCRVLPRATFVVGAFYLVAGLVALAVGQGEQAFSPWLMGLPFACGQLLTALILYLTLERENA